MSSFQAKLGRKRQRKRGSKNYHFVPFLPDELEIIPKKQHKNSKNYKILLWHHFKSKKVGKG